MQLLTIIVTNIQLPYTIPDWAKYLTEAVKNLLLTLKTCKMLKINLSKLKKTRNIRFNDATANSLSTLTWLKINVKHLTSKALHTKRDKRHFCFWKLSKWRPKKKGEWVWYIISTPSENVGTRLPWPHLIAPLNRPDKSFSDTSQLPYANPHDIGCGYPCYKEAVFRQKLLSFCAKWHNTTCQWDIIVL